MVRNILSPGTCGCQVTFEWDNTLPIDEVVIHQVDAELCPRHALLSKVGHYQRVVEEGNRLGRVRRRIADDAGEDSAERTAWWFDAQHVLHLDLSNRTRLRREALRQWLTNNALADKVIVEPVP